MKTIPLTAAAPAVTETPEALAAPAELAFISPQAEAVRVGYAGEDPADIARYLLASGAQAASLSPDGETLAARMAAMR